MLPEFKAVLDRTVAALQEALGDDLCSCCVYGSVVRGNAIEGVSDINLLIVLRQSSPPAHQAIAKVLSSQPRIDPFVLSRRGFERSVRAFAPKFQSIHRHYLVLCGEDLLASLQVDPQMERFLCEQSLRNIRLRMVFAFVTRERHKAYDRFLVRHVTPLFLQFSEVLRLNGATVPKDFPSRIALAEKEFGADGATLRDLLELKARPRRLNEEEVVAWHNRVFPFVDKVIDWIEAHWPA